MNPGSPLKNQRSGEGKHNLFLGRPLFFLPLIPNSANSENSMIEGGK